MSNFGSQDILSDQLSDVCIKSTDVCTVHYNVQVCGEPDVGGSLPYFGATTYPDAHWK